MIFLIFYSCGSLKEQTSKKKSAKVELPPRCSFKQIFQEKRRALKGFFQNQLQQKSDLNQRRYLYAIKTKTHEGNETKILSN